MRKGMKLGMIGMVLAVGLLFLILPTTKEVIVRVPLPLERVILEFEDTARLFRGINPIQIQTCRYRYQKRIHLNLF